MKVLITGATGLVGQAIVQKLIQSGTVVHYLSTRKSKIKKDPKYIGFHWNPALDEIDDKALNGVSHIINLAGASISKRWTSSYKKEILQSRIDSLKTLRKAISAQNNDIVSFISASAIGIYPNSERTLYTEKYDGHADNSFLGEVVADWEEEINAFESFDFPVAKVRIGLVLSKAGGALPKMAGPMKWYVGAAFGSGEQWQSWVHIDDLARMFLFIADNKLAGTYNGVAPNPVTNNKLTLELAKVLGKPLLLPNVPKFAMQLVLGEMAYLLFASQRVSSRKIENAGFDFNYPNICKSLENIYLSTSLSGQEPDNLNEEYI